MSKHVRPGVGKTLLLERYVWWQLKAGFAFHFGRIIRYVRPLPSNNPGRRARPALSHSDPERRISPYNIAPSRKVLTIRFNPETRARSLDALLWRGTHSPLGQDLKIAYRTINARADTVDKALSFRQAFRKRRCPDSCGRIL